MPPMETPTPPPVCLQAGLPGLEADLNRLARRYDLPTCQAQPDADWRLVLTPERLQLEARNGRQGPVYVDFVGGALGHRRRFGGGRGQPLARAVGMQRGRSPRILDATAGLARDAFVLASLGSDVTLCERSPVLAALIDDGLRRALADDEVASIARRMTLLATDAADHIRTLSGDRRPEVIYLDPMYPAGKDTVLVKKEMQALQRLLGPDRDSGQLFDAALAGATRRVVVKRPRRAAWLLDRKPAASIESKKTRYDIYICQAATPP